MQMVALTEQISSSEEDMRLLKLQLKTNEVVITGLHVDKKYR